jgi:hypothetical protein
MRDPLTKGEGSMWRHREACLRCGNQVLWWRSHRRESGTRRKQERRDSHADPASRMKTRIDESPSGTPLVPLGDSWLHDRLRGLPWARRSEACASP